MSSPSASHNNHDPFVILPQDIVLEILSYLTLEELCAVDNVSTHWRAAIWPRVWRAMCEREWVDGFEDKYRDAARQRLVERKAYRTGIAYPSTCSTVPITGSRSMRAGPRDLVSMIADGATVFLDRKVQIVHRRKLLRVVCIVDDYVVWRALDDPRALEVEYWVDGSPDIIQTVSRITTEVNKPLAVPVEGRPSATRKSQIGVVGINNRLRIYDCASGACEDPRGIYLPSRYAIREPIVDDDYVIFAADGHLTVQLRKTGKVLFKYPSPVNPDDPTGAIAAVAFKFPTASYLQWKNEVDEHGQIRRFEPIRGEWLRRTKVTLRRFEDLGSLEGTWTDDDDGDLPPWDDGGHEDDGEDGEDEDDEDEDDEDDEDEDDDQHEDDEDDDQTHQDQQDNYAGSLWEEDSEIYDDDVLLWVDELADPGEVHNELSGERYDVLPPAPVNFFDCEELTGPMTMRWRSIKSYGTTLVLRCGDTGVVIVRDYREVLRRIARATPEVRSHFFAAHAVLVSCYPWDIHPIVMHSAGSGDFLVTYAENFGVSVLDFSLLPSLPLPDDSAVLSPVHVAVLPMRTECSSLTTLGVYQDRVFIGGFDSNMWWPYWQDEKENKDMMLALKFGPDTEGTFPWRGDLDPLVG